VADGDFFFPTEGAGSGAPQVDDGLALWRLDDIQVEVHEQWAVDKDQYGRPDDGRRIHFIGTLMDSKTEEHFGEDGDPVQLEKLTRPSTGPRSGTAAVMEGLLTPVEFKAWQAAVAAKQPYNNAAAKGRVYNVKIKHSQGGWPQIEDVIGQAK
jgi:hypothetical protein